MVRGRAYKYNSVVANCCYHVMKSKDLFERKHYSSVHSCIISLAQIRLYFSIKNFESQHKSMLCTCVKLKFVWRGYLSRINREKWEETRRVNYLFQNELIYFS